MGDQGLVRADYSVGGWVQGLGGQTTDIDIHARELLRTRERLNQILAQHTGRPLEEIMRDTDRDYYLSSEEAKAYGLVDSVESERPAAGARSGAAAARARG